jgi:hypothetical protein
MAKFTTLSKMEFKVTLEMTEEEARALDALIGYDVNEFIKNFYTFLGKVYMEEHEEGLRSLFHSRDDLRNQLHKITYARNTFYSKKEE